MRDASLTSLPVHRQALRAGLFMCFTGAIASIFAIETGEILNTAATERAMQAMERVPALTPPPTPLPSGEPSDADLLGAEFLVLVNDLGAALKAARLDLRETVAVSSPQGVVGPVQAGASFSAPSLSPKSRQALEAVGSRLAVFGAQLEGLPERAARVDQDVIARANRDVSRLLSASDPGLRAALLEAERSLTALAAL
ncbi:MAG: hypothetical protein AAF869_06285 [Pseudomonadota bacterium]